MGMIEQEKREKVIHDVFVAFEEWEYQNSCPGEDWSDIHESMNIAIAALKAEKPRVMGLNELLAFNQGWVVWLEDIDKPDVIPGLFVKIYELSKQADFQLVQRIVTANLDEYGERWRCWTSCPDDTRRAETPWE